MSVLHRRPEIEDYVLELLERASGNPHGIAGVMMATEIAAGGQPYHTASTDWVQPTVVAQHGSEVHIVAVMARNPRSGALQRLIEKIRNDGLTPVVVEPIGHAMPEIMKQWGWKVTRRGSGFESREEWRAA